MKTDFLYLKGKEVSEGVNYYIFECNGEKKRLSEDEAKQLISKFDSKMRNCKISKGRISLKPNEGFLKRKVVTKNKGVRIFTKLPISKKCDIVSNDAFFNRLLYEKDFFKRYRGVIKEMDGAEIIDYSLMTVKTPYGITNVRQFSTGLKTILNILYLMDRNPDTKYIVNVNECGKNALQFIYELINDSNISAYLSQPAAYLKQGLNYYVNNKNLESIYSFSDYLE